MGVYVLHPPHLLRMITDDYWGGGLTVNYVIKISMFINLTFFSFKFHLISL